MSSVSTYEPLVRLPGLLVSNYISDLVMYTVPCALALIYGFNVSSRTGQDCNSCTSATFPCNNPPVHPLRPCGLPVRLLPVVLFKTHAAAQTTTIMLNFVIGVVMMMVSFIMSVIGSTSDVGSVLVFVWCLSPLFNLGMGLLQLAGRDRC
ncbi:hypothetical protein F444_00271 [Phytophthora nicotianae P1976]|uniref:Uncharacterized protein n=1 Tax=Phytophthora nicotianae P1976 TaxID=1317066 RepID=A0A081B4T6_PHYNI|nr:hypothetical protein F444_00271 [Phytophthora nicotianae P1976]